MKDMATIKNNRDKLYDSIGLFLNNFGNSLTSYVMTISERTLSISSIVILHSVFAPNIFAYLSSYTEKLPSLDSVILVLIALTIMAFHSIIKKDTLATIVHLLGFIGNSVLLSFVVFK